MFLEKMIKVFQKKIHKDVNNLSDKLLNSEFIVDTRNIITNCKLFSILEGYPNEISFDVRLVKKFIDKPKHCTVNYNNELFYDVEFYSDLKHSTTTRSLTLERNSNISGIDFLFEGNVFFDDELITSNQEDSNKIPFKYNSIVGTKNFAVIKDDIVIDVVGDKSYKNARLNGTTVNVPLLQYGGFYPIGSSPNDIKQTYVICKVSPNNKDRIMFVTKDDILQSTNGVINLEDRFTYNKLHAGFVKDYDVSETCSLAEFIKSGMLNFSLSDKDEIKYQSYNYQFFEKNQEVIKIYFKKTGGKNV